MTTLSIEDLKAWLELLPRLPAGPWVVQDGCSWRRIGTTTGRDTDGTVLRPTVAGDGHPDLECGRGQDREAILAHLAKCDPATIAALIEGYVAMAEAKPKASVKPLEWKKNGNDPDSVWTGELASLRVFYTIDPEGRVFRLERGWQLSEYPRDDLGLFPTRAEAERYANDDWQAKLTRALNIGGTND